MCVATFCVLADPGPSSLCRLLGPFARREATVERVVAVGVEDHLSVRLEVRMADGAAELVAEQMRSWFVVRAVDLALTPIGAANGPGRSSAPHNGDSTSTRSLHWA